VLSAVTLVVALGSDAVGWAVASAVDAKVCIGAAVGCGGCDVSWEFPCETGVACPDVGCAACGGARTSPFGGAASAVPSSYNPPDKALARARSFPEIGVKTTMLNKNRARPIARKL
jgi:hypothetical protein